MSSMKCSVRLLGAFAALATLALAVSCKGFFVNQPTTVTVNPSAPSLTAAQQENFTAQAAFSDNSSKDVTASATWTSSNPCIVAIISSGSNAGHATDLGTGGSATITASYAGVIGTATATVSTGLTISPCSIQTVGNFPEAVFNRGSSTTFTASGSTGTLNWTTSDPNVVTINSTSGAASFVGAGTATIQATDNTNTGTLYITVQ